MTLLPLAFLGVFFLYPLARILGYSLVPDGIVTFDGFARLISDPYYRDVLAFTTGQAIASTILTVLLALPGAYVVTRFAFAGKRLLLALATLPFVLPTVVVAAAFSAFVGERGLVNDLLTTWLRLEQPPIRLERTLGLILVVHVFYNYAIALRLISSFWQGQRGRIEEAARVLGASRWQVIWHITLPTLRPAIISAALLVFIFSFTSFGVVLLLGGSRYATIEVEIYRQATGLFNLPMAAALSLTQIGVMFLAMLAYTRLSRRITALPTTTRTAPRPPRGVVERLLVGLTIGGMTALLIAPLAALVLRSFTHVDGLTTRYYGLLNVNTRGSVLFVPPLTSIGNSLIFAGLTTAIALLLGVIAAYALTRGRWRVSLDALLMLPLATSAVTLGFGFILALNVPPLDLRSSTVLIPIAHTLVALPFVVRSILPVLQAIPPQLNEAAQALGASPLRAWWTIDRPLLGRGLAAGAIFAFTVSMGEFGASLFIARPDTPTIPVVIFRLLGQPGATNYGQAMAMSTILMGVCALGFLLIERLRGDNRLL